MSIFGINCGWSMAEEPRVPPLRYAPVGMTILSWALELHQEIFSRERELSSRPELRRSAVEGPAVLPPWTTRNLSRRLVLVQRSLFLLAMMSSVARAQEPVVLDHVVAVINGSVILESDVQEEMRLAVLQPFSDPGRNTPKRALQRLIDRDLILQQMRTAEELTPPLPEEVLQRVNELRSLIPECTQYHCETDAGWQAFLNAKGLTQKEVEAHWKQRMMILAFIQSRFGSGVRITPAEIADYYHKVLVPQLRGKTPPPLQAVSSRIEEILLQQRVSSLLLEWLQSLKSEGSVSILDPAYGQVGTTGSGDESDSGGQR
jgi:peptidyl-prolyl cis-trans isomerase SurA